VFAECRLEVVVLDHQLVEIPQVLGPRVGGWLEQLQAGDVHRMLA
jgi:hypothetical protein